MSFNSKNYQEGDKMVIGGALVLKEGATLIGFPKAENRPDSTATTIADLKSDFNTLLLRLKSAGLMESDS